MVKFLPNSQIGNCGLWYRLITAVSMQLPLKDKYPLPLRTTIVDQVAGSKTKLDVYSESKSCKRRTDNTIHMQIWTYVQCYAIWTQQCSRCASKTRWMGSTETSGKRHMCELASSMYKKLNSAGICLVRSVRKMLGCHGAVAHGMPGSRVLTCAADMLCTVRDRYQRAALRLQIQCRTRDTHNTRWLPEWLKTRCKQYSSSQYPRILQIH